MKTYTNTDTKRNYSGTVRLIFCILFAVVGVWFPSYFMWVVWAFVAYVALLAILWVFIAILSIVVLKSITNLG
jgi:hypothetical protein